MADATPHNDHNVYILGAGFSYDAGLPLMWNFLHRMRDSHAWLRAQGRQREADAVQAVLAFRLRAASAAFRVKVDVENIEELFSLASADATDEDLEPDQMALAIAATLDFARATAAGAPVTLSDDASGAGIAGPPGAASPGGVPARRPLARHDLYAGIMCGPLSEAGPDRHDTVLSFNYDLVLEEALGRLGVAYDHRVTRPRSDASRSGVPLLKLHGSMSWGHRGGRRPGKAVDRSSYREVLDARLVPLLVPPTWHKTFGHELGAIWGEAVSELQRATRIVVIGFSMALADTHFKYLLAAGLKKNVSLRQVVFVNPDRDGTLEDRVTQVFRREDVARGVIDFARTDVLGFFRDPARRAQIGRPLRAGLTLSES